MIKNLKNTHPKDIFPNVDFMEFVNCPVFVIHGTSDVEINMSHAKELLKKIKKPYEPFFVEQAGHNNIESDQRFRNNYFLKLRDFLKNLKILHASKSEQELLEYCRAREWDKNINHLYQGMIPQMICVNKINEENNNNNNNSNININDISI